MPTPIPVVAGSFAFDAAAVRWSNETYKCRYGVSVSHEQKIPN